MIFPLVAQKEGKKRLKKKGAKRRSLARGGGGFQPWEEKPTSKKHRDALERGGEKRNGGDKTVVSALRAKRERDAKIKRAHRYDRFNGKYI